MVLVLLIGDLHIPHRGAELPAKFKELLVPNKIQYILVTGNLCTKEQADYFRSLCSEVHMTKGDFDDVNLNLPEEKVITIGSFKLGLVHGHQIVPWGDKEALAITQRRLDVDILVSGHTHELQLWESDTKIFINPGSATGAYSGFNLDATPSFVLMDIGETSVVVFIYKLVDGALKVEKVKYEPKPATA